MVKTLVILILFFNGTVAREKIEFTHPISFLECVAFGDAYREIFSTHRWCDQQGAPNFSIDAMRQGWYLNDGRGTIQGIYCE